MDRKEKYENLLIKTYQLEGLLLRAMAKDDANDLLDKLIEDKIAEISGAEQKKPEPEPEPAYHPDPEPEPEMTIIEEPSFYALDDDEEEMPKTPVRPTVRKRSNPEPVFSLNDRFLYTRELFEGDKADFNAALKAVADMDTYEEAERYLVDTYGLNPDSDIAASFLEVIRNSKNRK